ncbi:chromate transporter [Polynucleobacter sp. UK-Kesae-W10]|uniref:chromate transporter n=1 Tax=Polynucleobacter sp. UK-Kesae-W10 TaxID=1819738 RepID=UPI001C0E2BFB|nr:chromate transporter [Polynucleobacter sp. UK-Kesae-W10]
MISSLISLFLKFSAFSLLAFGGINALLPVLYDLSVNQEHWINAQTFSDYFAIAQAAPGPNLMTVTLIGWNVGGVLGAVIATFAISWPSSIMIYFLQKSILGMQDKEKQQAIQFAAGALAVGLVLSAAWQISLQINNSMAAYLLTASTIAITFFTRWHPIYLIAIGAALGILGFI